MNESGEAPEEGQASMADYAATLGDAWRVDLAKRFGVAVKARRNELGLTAVELASRTTNLGFPINRVAIAKIENGHRGGRLDVAELIVLAAALETPPLALLFPALADEHLELLPHSGTSTHWAAVQWFSGEQPRLVIPPAEVPEPAFYDEGPNWQRAAKQLQLLRNYERLQAQLSEQTMTFLGLPADARASYSSVITSTQSKIAEQRERMREAGIFLRDSGEAPGSGATGNDSLTRLDANGEEDADAT